MNPRQTASAITNTLAVLDQYDAPLATRKTLEEGVEHATTAVTWEPPEAGDITVHAYNAIVAGCDPSTDKAVQRALFTDRLTVVREGVHARAGIQLAALVSDNLEQIVAALDAAYQEHVAEPATEAAATLADLGIKDPDTSSDVVLKSGDKAAIAWTGMRAARDAHTRILGAYKLLLGAAGIARGSDPLFLYVDPAGLDLVAVRNVGKLPHPWAVVNAGMALGIATPAAAAERQERAGSAVATQSDRDAAFRGEYRRTHGTGVGA